MHLTRRLRGRLESGGSTSGYSLIEILVVLVLLGVVGGIISSTIIMSMRTTRLHQNRTYAVDAVQTQLERLARSLRVADPIRAASATSMTVDLYRNSTCVRETWTASGTTLKVTDVTYPTWSSCLNYPATATPTSTTTTTALAALDNGVTSLFTFTDSTGTALSSPTVSAIAFVKITIVESVVGRNAPVTFNTSVGVRNEALA